MVANQNRNETPWFLMEHLIYLIFWIKLFDAITIPTVHTWVMFQKVNFQPLQEILVDV